MRNSNFYPVIFLNPKDNVGTAIQDIPLGTPVSNTVAATEKISFGFKVSLADITAGDIIYKYGIPITKAVKNIPAGSCVHIHNAKSLYDLRSAAFDFRTAAPEDMNYQLWEDME